MSEKIFEHSQIHEDDATAAGATAQPAILRIGRGLSLPYSISPLPLLALVIASCGLIFFVRLQLHNQSQTEYLIFYDFWRNYGALKNHELTSFFFHNVHTWAVVSAVWFLDVLLAAGSQKLLHGYVVAANLLAFCTIFLIFRRSNKDRGAPLSVTLAATITAAALWLSPSNSTSFIWPGVDVLAATTLLTFCLSEVIFRWNEESHFTSPIKLIVYAIASLFGFLTLETFLCLPLFYGLDSWIRGRIRASVSAIFVFVALLSTYLVFLRLGVTEINMETARAPLIIARNFLVLLSSHFGFLLVETGLSQRAVDYLSICLSIIQLFCFICFVITYYVQPAQKQSSPFRFAFALASFAVTALALATWLRFGAHPTPALDRYTWFGELFSIAVFLQVIDLRRINKNRVCEAARIVVVVICVTYLLGEQAALLLRSHNIGAFFFHSRLEMAVYAIAPGNEQSLGPAEPDEGVGYRRELHEFLKEHRLSVFRSAVYESLGAKISSTSEQVSQTSCVQVWQTPSARSDMTLYFMYFDGIEDNGFFIVADQNRTVTSFSFASRATPFDRTVVALLPRGDPADRAIYFVKFGSGKDVPVVPCH